MLKYLKNVCQQGKQIFWEKNKGKTPKEGEEEKVTKA